MQRDMYDTVTLPILIPCRQEEAEGTANFLSGFAGLGPVRSLRREELNPKNSKVWALLGPEKQKQLVSTIQLLYAVQTKDPLAIANAYERISEEEKPLIKAARSAIASAFKTYPSDEIRRILSKELLPLRLVLWKSKEGKLVPAFYSPDLSSGLLLYSLLKAIGSEGGLAVCPRCGTPFLQKRADQEFCSIECREAHRVARWRAKKKIAKSNRQKTAVERKGSARKVGR